LTACSVRRSGKRLRFTAQLVDASSGAHIWADRFEGEMDDVFNLQDRIAERVVAAIEPKMAAYAGRALGMDRNPCDASSRSFNQHERQLGDGAHRGRAQSFTPVKVYSQPIGPEHQGRTVNR
jgi:hypothetical protein